MKNPYFSFFTFAHVFGFPLSIENLLNGKGSPAAWPIPRNTAGNGGNTNDDITLLRWQGVSHEEKEERLAFQVSKTV